MQSGQINKNNDKLPLKSKMTMQVNAKVDKEVGVREERRQMHEKLKNLLLDDDSSDSDD